MAKQFIITGTVLGNLWMGGVGGYPMQPISAPTRKKAMDMATKRLEMNKLTGTGDFNGEIGALLRIKCITTRVIDGKEFTNSEVEPIQFIGEVSDEQADYLLDMD